MGSCVFLRLFRSNVFMWGQSVSHKKPHHCTVRDNINSFIDKLHLSYSRLEKKHWGGLFPHAVQLGLAGEPCPTAAGFCQEVGVYLLAGRSSSQVSHVRHHCVIAITVYINAKKSSRCMHVFLVYPTFGLDSKYSSSTHMTEFIFSNTALCWRSCANTFSFKFHFSNNDPL